MNIKLIWGVIVSPSETFGQIKREKPFFVGSIIWLFSCLFCFANLYVNSKLGDCSFFSLIVSIYPRIIWGFIKIFIYVFAVNFLAVKLYACKNDYTILLLCGFFISVIAVISCILTMLLNQFAFSIGLICSLWMSILQIIAIKKIYQVSGEIAFFLFVDVFILFFLLNILIVYLL